MNNPHWLRVSLTAVLALTVTGGFAFAQGNKPASKKPTPKKPPVANRKPGGPVVLGTTQLPGDFGQLGTTYTIGKGSPLNFTLKSAEYSVTPLIIGTTTYAPKNDEKLLVLHYTVHNPRNLESRYYWAEIEFTAVDATDTNRRFVSAAAREGLTQPLNISLKPAQKIEAWTIIIVPAPGMVPKLMIERERGAPVIRYDLRGKVKPLPAPFADPSDPSGATVAKEIPGVPGVLYPQGNFDIRLESAAYTSEPLNNTAPPAGKRYVTATFTLKNRAANTARYYWGDFDATLRDADGEKVAYNSTILKATRNEKAAGNLEPGEETRIRFYFALPTDVEAKTIRLFQHAGRGPTHPITFDLSKALKPAAAE